MLIGVIKKGIWCHGDCFLPVEGKCRAIAMLPFMQMPFSKGKWLLLFKLLFEYNLNNE